MSEDVFDEWEEDVDEWEPWATETLLKCLLEIEKEKKKLKVAIDKIKETFFYKEYIDKLYICKEDADRIVFSTKKDYNFQMEKSFLDELGDDFPYVLFNICYMEYFEDGSPALRLMEVIL